MTFSGRTCASTWWPGKKQAPLPQWYDGFGKEFAFLGKHNPLLLFIKVFPCSIALQTRNGSGKRNVSG